MGWTIPKTWSVEPLVASDLNTHLRDNMNHLHDRLENGAVWVGDEGSNYQTTSTSFTEIDDTEGIGKHTMTTYGGSVLLSFSGAMEGASGSNNFTGLDFEIDDVRVGGDEGLWRGGTNGNFNSFSYSHLVTDLATGEHTFKVLWANPRGGTATLYAGGGTGDKDLHPVFLVKEI